MLFVDDLDAAILNGQFKPHHPVFGHEVWAET